MRLNNENTDQISVFKQTSSTRKTHSFVFNFSFFFFVLDDEDAIAFDESLANSTATGRDAVRERYLALEVCGEKKMEFSFFLMFV